MALEVWACDLRFACYVGVAEGEANDDDDAYSIAQG